MGNSQPIQIGKDAKIRRFTVRKEYSGEKAKGVTRQPFVNALKGSKGIHLHRGLFENFRRVTHESPQPSQGNPEIEVGSSRKNLWRNLLSNEANRCDIHWRPTRFLLILHQHKHCQLGLKGTEKKQNERRLTDTQHSRGKKQDDKITQLQTELSVKKNVERQRERGRPRG